MHTRTCVCFFALTFLAGLCASVSAEEWQNFVYTGNITSLCASSTTIWIGTQGGVVALNKATSQMMHYTRADGLVALYAAQLGIGVDGSLWAVGQFSDLAQFIGTRWMSVPPPIHGLQSHPLATGFAIDHQGVKWLATQGGVLRFDGGDWTTFDPTNSPLETQYVSAVAVDRDNTKWFSTKDFPPDYPTKGVYSFDGENWQNFTAENSGLHTSNVGAIGVDADGGVWFAAGFPGAGASRLLDGVWTTHDAVEGAVLQISAAPDGNVWFASRRKLQFFDGTDWSEYSSQNSPLPGDKITSICFDSDGDLWVGTDQQDLFTFDGENWTVTDITFSGPAALNITQLSMPPPGGLANPSVWMTYYNGRPGVTNYNFAFNTWQTYTTQNSPIEATTIRTATVDRDGVVWLGTSLGVYSFDGTVWSDYTQDPDTLPSKWWNDIWFAAVDSQNVKWFCHGDAEDPGGADHILITSFDGTVWQSHDFGVYGGTPWPKCFAEDPDGGKWFGYGFGLLYFDGTDYAIYTPENSPLPWKRINAIRIEDNWEMWISGGFDVSGSVLHFDGQTLETLTTDNCGLASNGVNCIARDMTGRYWFGTSREGVSVYDGEGWITLDLDSSRISSNWVNSIALDFLGNRWIATWEGLSVLMAGPLANHYPQDPQVRADWQTALPGEPLTFSATADDPDGDALEFRFMWPDGATSEWSAYAQEMSFATAGTYQLRSSAKDSKKAVSRWSTPLTIAVTDEYAPFVAVSTNREEYHPGQTLSATVYVENRGDAKQVEAFMGVQLPDGTRLFYPDYSTTSTTFELSLHTGFKFGPFLFCELQISEALVPGRYTFFTAVLDAATGETISESEAVFELLGLGPL